MLPWQDIDDGSVAERMSRIVDALWSGLDSTPGRAVAALRSLLLRSTAEFTETYPERPNSSTAGTAAGGALTRGRSAGSSSTPTGWSACATSCPPPSTASTWNST